MEAIRKAGYRSGETTRTLLAAAGVDQATYYRWQKHECAARRKEKPPAGRKPESPPTPEEVEAVKRYALRYPSTGYKRLAWRMVDDGAAGLRPYQVLEVLRSQGLLARREASLPVALRRPTPPERPDEVWHIDLMYVQIGRRWFYLVDILDGYSRFLVHWSLNPTMTADTVVLTTQEALERQKERREGEPRIVHDHGSQFVSRDWKAYLGAVGATDIRTRVAHPESNGRLERLHRTHREEGAVGEGAGNYHDAVEAFGRWADYYNWRRPHSALKYLAPGIYYRGKPEEALERRTKHLAEAKERRRKYWGQHGPG